MRALLRSSDERWIVEFTAYQKVVCELDAKVVLDLVVSVDGAFIL